MSAHSIIASLIAALQQSPAQPKQQSATDDFDDGHTQYYQADEAWETINDDASEEAPATKRTKPSNVVKLTPTPEGAIVIVIIDAIPLPTL